MKKLFVFAGEKSADLHGYHLIQALNRLDPTYSITSVSGPKMRELNTNVILPTEEFEVMGFSAVLRSLPKIFKQFRFIQNTILTTNPEAVIFIDYPGFNLRLAKALRKKGFKGKLIQYVSPTFWAWGKGRKKTMIKNLDLLLTIYPFENHHFKDTPLKTAYVGNPSSESIHEHAYNDQALQTLGVPREAKLISLFPGSRCSEVERNLPLQLEAAKLFKEQHPGTLFAISCAHDKIMSLIKEMAASFTLNQDLFLVPKCHSYELMRRSHAAIAKSGTVTLELALNQCPTVVMYAVSKINYLIAKYLIRLKIPHFSMANILYQDTLFPELIKKGCTPKRLCEELTRLSEDPLVRKTCMEGCDQIKSMLKNYKTSERAAEATRKLLEKN